MSEETNRWSDDYSGRWKSRAYMVVPVADINSADAPTDSNTVAQIKTWMDSYGYSSKALLKFVCDNNPDNDPSVFNSYDKFSHEQIMTTLSGTEWTSAIE